jgi:hypothetical protein
MLSGEDVLDQLLGWEMFEVLRGTGVSKSEIGRDELAVLVVLQDLNSICPASVGT